MIQINTTLNLGVFTLFLEMTGFRFTYCHFLQQVLNSLRVLQSKVVDKRSPVWKKRRSKSGRKWYQPTLTVLTVLRSRSQALHETRSHMAFQPSSHKREDSISHLPIRNHLQFQKRNISNK